MAITLAIVLLLVVAIVPAEIQFNLTDKNLAANEVREFDGGELKIVIVTLIEGDDYICAGIFQWLTMPKGRHTDGFYISNYHDIPVHGDSASGYCEYKVNTEYLNGIKLVSEEKTIGEEISADDIIHISDSGFGCYFNLKDDVKQFGYPFMR